MTPEPAITRAEWRWLAIAAGVVMLMASLPMLIGYAVQASDRGGRVFVGTVYDIPDYFSHLAKIQLGLRGEYRYRSLFTPEAQTSEPIIYNDITLGAIARLIGWSASAAYEASRLLGGIAMLVMVYKFIAGFLEEVGLRRLAFFLAVAASGIGVFLITTPAFSRPNQSPIEFWLADGYLLFSLMAFPHFGWSIAAMLAAFLAWRRYADQPNWRGLAWLLAMMALTGLIQVFELALLDAVIGLDAIWRLVEDRRGWKPTLAAGAASAVLQAILVWPYVHALLTNELVKVWSGQSQTLSPPPVYYLAGYGLLWLLVIAGLAWAVRQRARVLVFPALWLAAVAVLVYSPDGIQYRWLEGVPVPLAIFGAVGLHRALQPWLLRKLPSRFRAPRLGWWLRALTLLALLPSTLYLVAGNSLLAAVKFKDAYMTTGQVAAVEWLAAHSAPDDTVLAGQAVGLALPGWTGHRTFLGHWAETMYYTQKAQQVKAFFSAWDDKQRMELLRYYGIRYVFYGPEEHGLGGFDPIESSFLTLVYDSEGVSVFVVHLP